MATLESARILVEQAKVEIMELQHDSPIPYEGMTELHDAFQHLDQAWACLRIAAADEKKRS